ncbi:lipoprotein insertase outer membrane protein LolB [Vibrio ishigakensis]|uniref:lipoprotein insertase outer membrane protein LolB n=1 Tax=Vibrio ishigakensis TaxID=1481914 RepID=UPI0021C3D41C|nr:lipoprotein insertase outer membrane protein LolB [Vibrio ishigakensis]
MNIALHRFSPSGVTKLFTLILALFIFGCETTSQLPVHSVEYQAHQEKLSTLEQYQVSGKLGYIDPTQRQSLNFNWRHAPDSSQLRLTTFLGKTVLTLDINSEGATLTDMDGNRYFDKDADLLFYQLTGMRLPIVYMQDWVKGQPTAADAMQVSDRGTLDSLSQTRGGQTWQLAYLGYTEQGDFVLPQKMTLSREEIKLNIQINKWNID